MFNIRFLKRGLSFFIFLLYSFNLFSDTELEKLHEIDVITVTGTDSIKSLKDSPIYSEIIDRSMIDSSVSTSLRDVLSDYGLQFTENGMGSYINLQGMGQSRVLFLIDGRRVTGRVSRRIESDLFSVGNINRIEIVRGPQSSLYGSNALGGVINIITSKPSSDFSFRSKFTNSFPGDWKELNLFRQNTWSNYFEFGKSPVHAAVYADFDRTNYLFGGSELSIEPKSYKADIQSKIHINPADNYNITTGGNLFISRRDNLISKTGGLLRHDVISGSGYFDSIFNIYDTADITFKIYHNYYKREKQVYSSLLDRWSDNDINEENLTSAKLNSSLYFQQPRGHFNTLTFGLEGEYNRLAAYNIQGDFKDLNTQSFYVQDEQFMPGKYSVITGFRVERNSAYGFSASPKISAMAYLTRDFRIFSGFGVGYRAPDFQDLYIEHVFDNRTKNDNICEIHGNTSLLPEWSLGYNAGADYSYRNNIFSINISSNFFHNELFDEMTYKEIPYPDQTAGSGTIYKRYNSDRTVRIGIDNDLRISFFKFFTISGGYSFVYSYDRENKELMSDQPAHTGRARISLEVRDAGFTTNLSASFMSAYKESSVNRFILNYYISKEVNKYVKIFGGIKNLTGFTDQKFGPYSGRNFSVGLEIEY